MLSNAIAMFLAIALFATYFSPQTRRRIAGYAFIVDVLIWTLFLVVFGGTGGERLGAIGATIGVTCAMHAYRWAKGYERLQGGRWVRYAGRFT